MNNLLYLAVLFIRLLLQCKGFYGFHIKCMKILLRNTIVQYIAKNFMAFFIFCSSSDNTDIEKRIWHKSAQIPMLYSVFYEEFI